MCAMNGRDSAAFFTQTVEAGRCLAKRNVPAAKVVQALDEYDALLSDQVGKVSGGDAATVQVARQQLLFFIILAINDAYSHVREAEIRTLQEIFRIEMEARNIDVLYRSFLEALAKTFGARAGHIYLLDTDRNCWLLKASSARGVSGQTAVQVPNKRGMDKKLSVPVHLSSSRASGFLDPGWAPQYRSVWSFPMKRLDEIAGVLQLGFDRENSWLPRDEELINAALERCFIAAERARLMEDLSLREDQIRHLAERMLHVEEMERRRISRELHDEAGQSLVCIRLQMELIELSLPKGSGEIAARLADVRDVTEKTILEMRRLIADLSPVVLQQFGLEAALRQLVKRLQTMRPISVKLTTKGLDKLTQQLQIIVYRILQECCNNVGKHSGASNVNISITSADGVLSLEVTDNGCGFHFEEALKKTGSFGLAGIRERVALLGGTFSVHSSKQQRKSKAGKKKRGTEVRVELPLTVENGWQK